MQDYTVLVTGIDGTLLDHDGRLPMANVEALRRWVDGGLTLALATGRNWMITRPVAEAIDRELFLILQDGCLLMHYPSLEILQYHNLPTVSAQTVCNLFRQERLSVMLFDPLPHGQSFTLREYGPFSTGLAAYLQAKIGLYHHCRDEREPLGDPSKVVTIDDGPRIEHLFNHLPSLLPEVRILRTEAVRLQAWFLEIGALEASKARALQQLVTYVGRDLAQVIAVGDAENDIEMLQVAGLGVAMGNGSERVKAAARLTIGTNREAGLARFVESILATSVALKPGLRTIPGR